MMPKILRGRIWPAWAALLFLTRFLQAGVLTEFLGLADSNRKGTVLIAPSLRSVEGIDEGVFLALDGQALLPLATPGSASPVPGYEFIGRVWEIALSEDDHAAFAARMRGPEGERDGLFLYCPSQGQVLPLQVGPAGSRVPFGGFSLSGGVLAYFYGTQTEEALMIFEEGASAPREVVRSGSPAPGGGSFESFGAPRLNAAGDLAFTATLSDGKEALFRQEAGAGLVRVVSIGDPLPGSESGTFSQFFDAVLTDSGILVFAAQTDGAQGFGGLFAHRPQSGLSVFVLDEQPLEGVDMRQIDFKRRIAGLLGGSEIFFVPPELRLDGSGRLVLTAATVPLGSPASPFVLQQEALFVLSATDPRLQPVLLEGDAEASGGFTVGSEIQVSLGPDSRIGIETAGSLLLADADGQLRRLSDSLTLASDLPQGPLLTFDAFLPRFGPQGLLVEAQFEFQGEPRRGRFRTDFDGDRTQAVAVEGQWAPETRPLTVGAFAHFADGRFDSGEIASTFMLFNPELFEAPIRLSFFDPQGEPAVVTIGGESLHSFRAMIPPLSGRSLESTPGSELRSGYVVIESGGFVQASEVFSRFGLDGSLETEAAVPASGRGLVFRIPVEARGELNTAIALANPFQQDAEVTFRLFDPEGVAAGETVRTIPAGGQLALFVAGELFGDLGEFEGTLQAESSTLLHAVALRTNQRTFTAYSVEQ